jgi:hypothetical protein
MLPPEFDLASAHRYFSAKCFNLAWKLIDKSNRSPEDDEQMLRLSQASLWHWTQRPDCQPRNLSIGYWQASRIHALLGRADGAKRYGELALSAAQEDPFLTAYAHEALARAARVANDSASFNLNLAKANQFAGQVIDEEDRQTLLKDLQELAWPTLGS